MTDYGYLGEDWSVLGEVFPTMVKAFGDSAQTRILYNRNLMQKRLSPKKMKLDGGRALKNISFINLKKKLRDK